MSKSSTGFKAELILVFVTILAAFGWIFSKEALAGLPPVFFMGTRFLIAGFVLCLVGQKYFRNVKWRDIKQACLVGAVMGLSMVFWITGLDQTTNLGVGAFIASLGVIIVPVMARFMFGQRPSMSVWVSLPVAVIGLAFLALGNGLVFETSQLYFLATAIGMAFQFNLLSRFSMSMHVLVLTAVQLMSAGVLLLVVSLSTETLPHAVSNQVAGWFLASTLIDTSFRFL